MGEEHTVAGSGGGTPVHMPPMTAGREERWRLGAEIFAPGQADPFVLLELTTVILCTDCKGEIAVVRDRKAATRLTESRCWACS